MDKTQIINNALLSIGEDIITDIDSANEPAAKIAKTLYDQSRKVVLSSADWPFVFVQEKLVQRPLKVIDNQSQQQVEIEYNADYPYVFALPANYLYIERIFIGQINKPLNSEGYSNRSAIAHNYFDLKPTKDWDIKYVPQLNTKAIVCKSKDNLIIEYVKDLDASNLYTDLFSEALSLFLAYKMSMPIKKDPKSAQLAYQMYENFMQKAQERMLNEMRNEVPDFVPEMVKARGDYYDKRYHK